MIGDLYDITDLDQPFGISLQRFGGVAYGYPPPLQVAAGYQYGPNGDDYTGAAIFSALTDAQQQQIDYIQTKLMSVGSPAITFNGPVLSDGSASIVQGDDYIGSRALSWTVNDYVGPDLTDATVTLGLMTLCDYNTNPLGVAVLLAGSVATSVGTDGGNVATFTVPIPASTSVTLQPSPTNEPMNWIGQLVAETSDGLQQTIAINPVTVRRGVVGVA